MRALIKLIVASVFVHALILPQSAFAIAMPISASTWVHGPGDPKAEKRLEKARIREEAKTRKLCQKAVRRGEAFLNEVRRKGAETPNLGRIADAIMSKEYGCNDPAFEVQLFELLVGSGDGHKADAITPFNQSYLWQLLQLYEASPGLKSNAGPARIAQLQERYWLVGGSFVEKDVISAQRKRQLVLYPDNWAMLTARDAQQPHLFLPELRAIRAELMLDPASPRFDPQSGINLHDGGWPSRGTMFLALLYAHGEHVPKDAMTALYWMRHAATVQDPEVAAQAKQWLASPLFAGIADPSPNAATKLFASRRQTKSENEILAAMASEKLLDLPVMPDNLAPYLRRQLLTDQDYPSRSLRQEIFGKVMLWAIFGPDGMPLAIEAKGDDEMLRDAAGINAARRGFSSKTKIEGFAGRYVRIPLPTVEYWLIGREGAEAAGLVPKEGIHVFANRVERILY